MMPQMGESIAEGTIVRWIKKVGDAIERDEPLFEISTDKVDAEIPSPGAGVLLEIRVNEGETVPVNSVVAVIGTRGRETLGSEVPGFRSSGCVSRRPCPLRTPRDPRNLGTSDASEPGACGSRDRFAVSDRRRSFARSRRSTAWTFRTSPAPAFPAG